MIRRILLMALAGVFVATLGLGCGSDGAAPKASTNEKAPDKKGPGGADASKSVSD